MNVYLKSAVQNLDCVIAQLTEYRNGLASYLPGAAPVIGAEAFAPVRADGARPVQTLEPSSAKATEGRPGKGPTPRVAAANRRKFQKHRRKQLAKQNGGGRQGKEEGGMPKAEASPPTPIVPRSAGGERAKTLGGAMKLIIGAMGTFTREALREAIEKDYGSEAFVKDASASAFPGNLAYWLKNGKLEESSAGVLKVADPAFFGNVEFK